ncbi:flagellar basal body L-ring protein FlgH [Piscinibacter koreensis]|uniref:Flagellar L-ring protein n=1 Tax=Piscinibacter koreensis TaxID=2742824 RepID=A0A7Y6NP77_9BURK|nr:flagellar basal body L-ring protein FlgH [Schlegelella koreensis]NUZ06820.1 flagellar basal body L-ring protein FlgH [Schlegelella koreensis]
MHTLVRLVPAAVLLVLAGCEAINARPPVDVAKVTYAAPEPVPVVTARNGSIYQAAQYRPLFEDHRARHVGDSLTVQIVEKISATQKSTSSIDKSGKVSGAATAFPLISATTLGKLNVGGSSGNSFSGAGTTESSNDFSGTITATVTGVLPNGHLLIAGEKQIGVNHSVDVLRFSGQVDPRAIQAGNTVASAQIANVRIEQSGRGAQAEAQGIGWLGRFFLNVLPV